MCVCELVFRVAGVYLSLCLCPCVKVCTCVFLWSASGTDTGAPAGNWAQASVSHLALVTDVWLQAFLWLCQKLGQPFLAAERDLRDWIPFFFFFLDYFLKR